MPTAESISNSQNGPLITTISTSLAITTEQAVKIVQFMPDLVDKARQHQLAENQVVLVRMRGCTVWGER